MPRPGQPGALSFNNVDVSEFLQQWESECEEFGLAEEQKCRKMPYYCSKDTRETVELLEGYRKKEMKQLYVQFDTKKNTTTALNKLVNDAPNIDLNVFVLKYIAITAALIEKGSLSPVERVYKLMDGL